jgi:uncharacterized membrane protein YgdD (TMEM256/DUF423 family)
MHPHTCVRLGAGLGALGVVLGAFAAHALAAKLEPKALQAFETGVRWQMVHALALLGCAALTAIGWRTRGAAVAFVLGTVLFSGSLYGLAGAGLTWLGPVTPIGGVVFVVGWVLLACGRPEKWEV